MKSLLVLIIFICSPVYAAKYEAYAKVKGNLKWVHVEYCGRNSSGGYNAVIYYQVYDVKNCRKVPSLPSAYLHANLVLADESGFK